MTRAALTVLSDDETMFRDAVAGFAAEEVRPRVQQMEREGKLDAALVTGFFEMGLMGVEVPEEYGGAGGSLMMVTLGVEDTHWFSVLSRFRNPCRNPAQSTGGRSGAAPKGDIPCLLSDAGSVSASLDASRWRCGTRCFRHHTADSRRPRQRRPVEEGPKGLGFE